MIICISYCLGEHSEYKYFNDFKSLNIFIKKLVDVSSDDYCRFEISVHKGKEEDRIRKIIESKVV
jgi:hypothetical protein